MKNKKLIILVLVPIIIVVGIIISIATQFTTKPNLPHPLATKECSLQDGRIAYSTKEGDKEIDEYGNINEGIICESHEQRIDLTKSFDCVNCFCCVTNKQVEAKRNQEFELFEKYKDNLDSEEYYNELLQLQIEQNLGVDFPQEKINQLKEVGVTLLKERKDLDNNSIIEGISDEEYLERMENIVQTSIEKYKEILTLEEYDKFVNYYK